MTEAPSQEILYDMLRLGESFREAVRRELSECDAETLLFKTHRGYEKWTGGSSVMNVTRKITREEATKLFYYPSTETLQGHNDSKGVHTMTEAPSQKILDELLRLEESFREAVRNELSECDRETLLSEIKRIHEKWPDDFYSVMGVARSITHDEAMELYYG